MKMNRTYRYRLHITPTQASKIDRHLELCRLIYNKMLKQRIDIYKRKGISLSYSTQQRQLPLIKDNRIVLDEVYAQVLQGAVRRVDTAFKNFFRRVRNKENKVGFPRFKGKDRLKSLTYNLGFKINDNKVTLGKLGAFKFRKSREIKGEVKYCILRKINNKYYICFVTELIKPEKIVIKSKVGIDVGINQFATLSNGEVIETVKHLKKRSKRLGKEQQVIARKIKGGKNRKRQRIRLGTQYEKVTNSRNDFLHKESTRLIQRYDLFVFENLKIKNMTKSAKGTIDNPGKSIKQKSGLNKSILDMSWNKFIGMMTYKAEDAGKEIILINPRNTSKTCSCCGKVVKEQDEYRVFRCGCGLVIDRDLNAAKNILSRYLTTVRNTESNACGDMSSQKTLSPRTPLSYVKG